MKVSIGEVELSENGQSSNGRNRFKGEVALADGSKAYITVYQAAPVAAAKPPTVRKAKGGNAQSPVADIMAALSPEKLAQLGALLATLKPAPEAKKEEAPKA